MINAEVRRMNYVAASPEDRAKMREIITSGLASLNHEAHPDLARDFEQTLAIFDEVDGADEG